MRQAYSGPHHRGYESTAPQRSRARITGATLLLLAFIGAYLSVLVPMYGLANKMPLIWKLHKLLVLQPCLIVLGILHLVAPDWAILHFSGGWRRLTDTAKRLLILLAAAGLALAWLFERAAMDSLQ